MALDLCAPDPVFELKLPDGTVRTYDPFVLDDKIGQAARMLPADASNEQHADAIRGACGLPSAATASATGEWTPSIHQTVLIVRELVACLDGLSQLKKDGGGTQS